MTKVLTYIEIDIPFCANTYGIAPCTASLSSSPPTGTRKCFNTPNTCQDRVNYIDDPVTLRFSFDSGNLPADIPAIPSIAAVSFNPATVSLGKDLGTRASLSVTFVDMPWPDTGPGFDKYLSERPYNPFTQGSFWGKFRARQPFLRGRAMRLIRGEEGQAIGDMETRHYIIDSFTHDTADGTYVITAKDVLKFADDDRSQAPVLSQGFLNAGITSSDSQLTLQPTGIGEQEYPATGMVAIGGKEVVSFVRDSPPGNDANTILYLQCNGSDTSTSFPDSSASAKTVTANGNAQVDTSDKKFGTGSAQFDGTGDYLSLADHADWTPAGNFTIDFWARWSALASTQYLFTHFTDANNRYFLNVSSTGVLTFSVISAGVTIITMASAAAAVSVAGGWTHIAVVRNGNVFNIYVNGVSVATTTDSDAIPNFTSNFRIGIDHAAANGFNGRIDTFRFSLVARWTAAFTPPTIAYQSSGDILFITRAQLNTTAIDHDANDRVQVVLRYQAEDVADIIRDLLVNYAGVDDSYIPITDWQAETGSFLNRVFSADIAEPTGVDKLISELIEDAALSVWWDDINQKIRLRVLRAISTTAALYDQDIYMQGTYGSREQPNERRSQIWRYFAKRNPLEGQDEPDNYRSVALTIDLEAETDYGSSAIQKIFSRWIPFGGRTIADKANSLYLSRFRDPPRRFNFSIFKNGINEPELGQGYRIGGFGIQDDTGAADSAPIQITRLNPTDTAFVVEAEEMLVAAIEEEDLSDRVIIIDSNILNISLRDVHDALYPEVTDDDVTNGVNLTCYIESGVIVGSANNALPSFDVGDWPVGFPITLVINGRIQGYGGDGGSDLSGNDGEDGGDALYCRFNIDVEMGSGEIWGGGGGGGAGGNRGSGASQTYGGGGGGGGAGSTPGDGGNGATGSSANGGDGQDGTTEAGGSGGGHNAGGDPYAGDGGDGGDPGMPGTAGGGSTKPGSGGAAGTAIDGVSFLNITVGPGDIRGAQIN